jgi:hypothetical protein
MAMVRKQIYISREEDAVVKRLAAELGVSEAGVIRLALDQLDASREQEARRTKAWEELEAFMDERSKLEPPPGGWPEWKFNREEIYEERMARSGPDRGLVREEAQPDAS